MEGFMYTQGMEALNVNDMKVMINNRVQDTRGMTWPYGMSLEDDLLFRGSLPSYRLSPPRGL